VDYAARVSGPYAYRPMRGALGRRTVFAWL
jgi:hypothetical protein